MTLSPVPTYDPAEWTPEPMTAEQYQDRRDHLTAQLAAAKQVVAAYDAAFAAPVAHPVHHLHETVGTAWNAAHDAVTAVEAALDALDSEYRWQDVDPYQRFLVANNID